jgi:hypothetical protein
VTQSPPPRLAEAPGGSPVLTRVSTARRRLGVFISELPGKRAAARLRAEHGAARAAPGGDDGRSGPKRAKIMCSYVAKGNCSNGDACGYAHSTAE